MKESKIWGTDKNKKTEDGKKLPSYNESNFVSLFRLAKSELIFSLIMFPELITS
jgi:hypothetical protein